jgi:hypothetical protein
MTGIKCIENMQRLKELLLKGEKGDAAYFSAKLDVDERSFYRLKNYLEFTNGLKIKFDRTKKTYYLE